MLSAIFTAQDTYKKQSILGRSRNTPVVKQQQQRKNVCGVQKMAPKTSAMFAIRSTSRTLLSKALNHEATNLANHVDEIKILSYYDAFRRKNDVSFANPFCISSPFFSSGAPESLKSFFELWHWRVSHHLFSM